METFLADDGRKLEIFTKQGETEAIEGQTVPQKTKEEDANIIFVGVASVMTEEGPREIKFQIKEVATVEEAFNAYHDCANKTVQELKEKIQQQQMQQDNKIVTAGAGALDALDEEAKQGNLIL